MLETIEENTAPVPSAAAVLLESEERHRALFEEAPIAYHEIDSQGIVRRVNRVECGLLGIHHRDMLGRPIWEFVAADQREASRQAIAEKLSGEKALIPFTRDYLRRDGERLILEIHESLIRDTQGNITGIRSAMIDVTAQRRAEELSRRASAELIESNEEIKRFTYVVSHDLRAPLVNLKGFASELRIALNQIQRSVESALPHMNELERATLAAALDGDVPEALDFIETSASRMEHFIAALLKLSRLGRREYHPEPLDMDTLFRETLQTLAHEITTSNVQVHATPLPGIVADPTAIEQILDNLLHNAVIYRAPNRPAEIWVSAVEQEAETIFEVRDNGRGIRPEDMSKIFMPFRRGHNPDVPGEGLGLAYVQVQVRRHGGRIWCESEPGVGTTFRFTIPKQSQAELRNVMWCDA
jgi:PAS domain S-box-containing protein